jgi:hypothetical protein
MKMNETVSLEGVYGPSGDVVAREIEGEIVIVPLVAGIGDMEDELYALNETGRAVWGLLDGVRPLKDVVQELAGVFDATPRVIEEDVIGLLGELLKRKMVVVKD